VIGLLLPVKANYPDNNLQESVIPSWYMALLIKYAHRQHERNFLGNFFI